MAISAWAGLAQAYQSATASVAGGIDAWIDNVAAPLFVLSGLSATLLSILCKRKQGLLEKHRNQPKRLDLETTQARPLGSSSKSHNHSRSLLSPLSAQAATQNLMGSGYERRLLVAMVGLPARGKSYIVQLLSRYLRWCHIQVKVFNVGEYRRKLGLAGADKDFFDSSNESAAQAREEMAAAVLDEAYEWLGSGGDDEPRVAFFDATNTTMMRRSKLLERNRREKVEVSLIFVESLCDDPEVLHRNYALKLQNKDYKGMEPTKALKDFMERVAQYERVYQPLNDDEDEGRISYIKMYNVGQKLATRYCNGYMPSEICLFLRNVHINPRKIWFSRHAESIDQVKNLLGRDNKDLTEAGRQYVILLHKFIKQEQEKAREAGREDGIMVLCGTQAINIATLEHLQLSYPCVTTSLLNELRGGDMDGWNRDDIKTMRPDVYNARETDKLNYRYPGAGESYTDVMQRVRPVIIELERQRQSVVVISHLAVQRCLYAYFMGIPPADLPYLQLPHHTVYELEPGPFGCRERRISLFELDHLM